MHEKKENIYCTQKTANEQFIALQSRLSQDLVINYFSLLSAMLSLTA